MTYRDPKIDEKIYVPSSLYVYRGADDFAGGLATICHIDKSKSLPATHFNYIFIEVKERPGTMYNWKTLLEQQEELEKQYAGMVAHSDPDYSPEMNPDPNADWK